MIIEIEIWAKPQILPDSFVLWKVAYPRRVSFPISAGIEPAGRFANKKQGRVWVGVLVGQSIEEEIIRAAITRLDIREAAKFIFPHRLDYRCVW